MWVQAQGRGRAERGGLRTLHCELPANKRADEYLLVRSLALSVVLLEQYFQRELNLAFRLSSSRKEAEVGIRHSVVRLTPTLKRAKGCLIPGVEEVGSEVDTSPLFAEWKHLFER